MPYNFEKIKKRRSYQEIDSSKQEHLYQVSENAVYLFEKIKKRRSYQEIDSSKQEHLYQVSENAVYLLKMHWQS